jgi:hypothetical protein
MADVQRAGGVGRDELDHHMAPAGALAAVAHPPAASTSPPRLARRGRQPQVDEAGAGDLERFDTQRCTAGSACSCGHQRLGQSRGFFFSVRASPWPR